MRLGLIVAAALCSIAAAHARAPDAALNPAPDPADAVCPRPLPGAAVEAPPELHSANGTLELTLHLRTAYDRHRLQRFCYRAMLPDGREVEAPTLRVQQGDTLVIHFANELSTDIHPQTAFPNAARAPAEHDHTGMLATGGLPSPASAADAPCFATSMSATGSNLHFHGVNAAPVCHQDEVIHTLVRSGETFDYRVHIPAAEPPGLYWYHPHAHGFSEAQVLGGASGALIVEATQTAQSGQSCHPERSEGSASSTTAVCSMLPERTLILRDQLITESTAARHAADKQLPTWDISLNFVPVLYPSNQPARLMLPPAAHELWRILNASADLTVDLEYIVDGKAQAFAVRAIDGVPLRIDAGRITTHLFLPPGARAEVTATTPPATAKQAELRTLAIDTGPDGETEPQRTIATITTTSSFSAKRPPSNASSRPQRSAVDRLSSPLAPVPGPSQPVYQRKLYFSEHSEHPGDKEALTAFYLTVDGKIPSAYRMGEPPDVRVHRGVVEEWTIENRARELHIFHIHQLHFIVTSINGVDTHDDTLHDTIAVPYWKGSGPYPSVTVRLDFRDRNITGTFVYHCHILGHEDAGMMGVIEVLPEGIATQTDFVTGQRLVVSVKARDLAQLPTGTVQIFQGGRQLGEAVLLQGQATLRNVEKLTTEPMTAIYAGDAFFQPSASAK